MENRSYNIIRRWILLVEWDGRPIQTIRLLDGASQQGFNMPRSR